MSKPVTKGLPNSAKRSQVDPKSDTIIVPAPKSNHNTQTVPTNKVSSPKPSSSNKIESSKSPKQKEQRRTRATKRNQAVAKSLKDSNYKNLPVEDEKDEEIPPALPQTIPSTDVRAFLDPRKDPNSVCQALTYFIVLYINLNFGPLAPQVVFVLRILLWLTLFPLMNVAFVAKFLISIKFYDEIYYYLRYVMMELPNDNTVAPLFYKRCARITTDANTQQTVLPPTDVRILANRESKKLDVPLTCQHVRVRIRRFSAFFPMWQTLEEDIDLNYVVSNAAVNEVLSVFGHLGPERTLDAAFDYIRRVGLLNFPADQFVPVMQDTIRYCAVKSSVSRTSDDTYRRFLLN